MKRIILFFSMLMFTGTNQAMEIGVIKEFSNRRPAFNRFKVEGSELHDFNRDGTPDIVVTFNDTIFVIDPGSKEQLWSLDVTTLGVSEVEVVGFLNMTGPDVSHVLFYSGINSWTGVFNVNRGALEYQNGDDPLTRAVLKHPRTGKQIIAVELDAGNKVIALIGEIPGNNTPLFSADANERPTRDAMDYLLEMKFQGEPGLKLAYDPDLFDPAHDMDLDGDQHLDIPMLIEDPDANNAVVGMVVRGGDNFNVLWQFPFPQEHIEDIRKGFHGFVDADGDGQKEAIMGQNLAVTLDGTVHTIAENFVTLDVNDIDNDGFEDIIGLNTTDSTVVVYGAMTTTSVEDTDPLDMHFQLFQNYPNPFNPNTTISYSVAHNGEVTLTIFNARGQTVRTLVNGTRSTGEYSLTWDGRDDAGQLLGSGPYFYRLQVGEAVQTRRMLFLK